MYELKKIGKVFTSKFVGSGPSSYEKRIYRVAVSQRLRNTVLEDCSKQRDTGICRSSVPEIGCLEILTVQSECTAVDRTYCSVRVIG
jgi:hypothetical protein